MISLKKIYESAMNGQYLTAANEEFRQHLISALSEKKGFKTLIKRFEAVKSDKTFLKLVSDNLKEFLVRKNVLNDKFFNIINPIIDSVKPHKYEGWMISADDYRYDYCRNVKERPELYKKYTDDKIKIWHCKDINDRKEVWSTITDEAVIVRYCATIADRKELWMKLRDPEHIFNYMLKPNLDPKKELRQYLKKAEDIEKFDQIYERKLGGFSLRDFQVTKNKFYEQKLKSLIREMVKEEMKLVKEIGPGYSPKNTSNKHSTKPNDNKKVEFKIYDNQNKDLDFYTLRNLISDSPKMKYSDVWKYTEVMESTGFIRIKTIYDYKDDIRNILVKNKIKFVET